MTLNELAYAAFSTNSGTTGTLNEVTYAYLSQVSGLASGTLDEQWLAALAANGYSTGTIHERQIAYWAGLGYTGTWNEMFYQWLSDGGAFGPAVQITASDPQPFCDYAPAGTCAAAAQYTANDSGFTNPADTWLWSLEPPVAGVVITNGTTKVCTVTSTTDADVSFNLKVVATDSVSTDTANKTVEYTHYHRENLAVTIGEETNPGCTWPVDDPPGCTAEATYKSNHTGTPTSFVWLLSDITGGTATITAGQGTANITVQTVGATTVAYKLTLDAESEFQTAQDSQNFQQTHAEESTGPAFYALSYDPADIAVIGAAYEMKGVVTGTGDLTTTHTADLYAPDFEGVYRGFGANEPVWSGGRSVTNLMRNSEGQWQDTNWWVPENGGTIDANGVVTSSGTNVGYGTGVNNSHPTDVLVGETWILTLDIELLSGNGELKIRSTPGVFSEVFFTLTPGRKKVSFPLTATSSNINISFRVRSANGPQSFQFFSWQVENTTGRTDTDIPSEYINNDQLAEADIPTKTFANLNGNTVLSNVVTEAVGAPLSEVPYLQYYPAAENARTYSNQLQPATGVWNLSSGALSTYDQIGLTGEPNTASLLTDPDVGQTSLVRDSAGRVTIPADTNPFTFVMWIKKDTDQTRFPQLRFYMGSAGDGFYVFNTETGELKVASGTPITTEVVDTGLWWKVMAEITNDGTITTTTELNIQPAFNSDFSTAQDITATGSIIVGNVDYHINKSIPEVRGLGPIFTTTAAVAVDKTEYTFDIANHNNSEGAYYTEFVPSAEPDSLLLSSSFIATGINGRQMYVNSAVLVKSWDGSQALNGPTQTIIVDAVLPAGMTYYDVSRAVNASGAWGLDGTYGAFAVEFAEIKIMRASTPSNPMLVSGKIRELQRYDITSFAEGKDIIDGLMAADYVTFVDDELVTFTDDEQVSF